MFKHDRSAADLVRILKRERQEVCTSTAHGRYDLASGEPMPGWGGLEARRKDLDGGQAATVNVQPTVLGQVSFNVIVATQASDASRPHSKTVYVEASIEDARYFAQVLLEAANIAEKHLDAERRRRDSPRRPNLRVV